MKLEDGGAIAETSAMFARGQALGQKLEEAARTGAGVTLTAEETAMLRELLRLGTEALFRERNQQAAVAARNGSSR